MPIADLKQSAQQIASFLNAVIRLGGLRLKYRISAGAPPEDAETGGSPVLNVEISGPDAPMLTQRGGELLRSLEHIAVQILRLERAEHDLVNFDALNFKAIRAQEIQLAAAAAAERVRESGTPFSFPPTNSRERRMMHLALKEIEDVESASIGEGQERYLVVYPKGQTHLPAPIPAMPARPSYGADRGRGPGSSASGRPRRGRPRDDGGFNRR